MISLNQQRDKDPASIPPNTILPVGQPLDIRCVMECSPTKDPFFGAGSRLDHGSNLRSVAPTSAATPIPGAPTGHIHPSTFGHQQLTHRDVIVTTNRQIPPADDLCVSVRRTHTSHAFLADSECALVAHV